MSCFFFPLFTDPKTGTHVNDVHGNGCLGESAAVFLSGDASMRLVACSFHHAVIVLEVFVTFSSGFTALAPELENTAHRRSPQTRLYCCTFLGSVARRRWARPPAHVFVSVCSGLTKDAKLVLHVSLSAAIYQFMLFKFIYFFCLLSTAIIFCTISVPPRSL